MSQFDTHTVIKELVQAGMPEPQAEIIVFNQSRLIDERLATKKDIESLRAETQQSFAAVHKDIEIIHKDIESLRAETQKSMQVLGSQLILKMGAMLVVAVGLLTSLQTFAG